MGPTPGDRVLIIENALDYITWGDYFALVATKGSIARALSFEEYFIYYDTYPLHHPVVHPRKVFSPAEVKKFMDDDFQFPFMFETVEPPDPAISDSYKALYCAVGDAIVLSPNFYQVIKSESSPSD